MWKETMEQIQPVSEKWLIKAKERLDNLTKPRESLGLLEEIAARYVAIKEEERLDQKGYDTGIRTASAWSTLGIFNDFSWQNTCQEFGRYNFFYGWNYCGKTTLSRLFRCLEIKAQHINQQGASMK